MTRSYLRHFFFFFNDTATTEIYTLSLHDALPICRRRGPATRTGGVSRGRSRCPWPGRARRGPRTGAAPRPDRCPSTPGDRKSTRLNSSHSQISYAVFCLKKNKEYNHFHDTCQVIG